MTSETLTADPTDYVTAVEAKARDEISAYLQVRDRSNPWRGRKAALEESVAEYETRFLVELIQNGYDAIRGTTTGRMRVLLRETEGKHGTVYVANSGRSFRKSNFDAICEFAQSDKHPGESVGSKGMGFKSTLAVCSRPEIYSRAPNSSTSPFDGYCFRFADDAADVLDYVDGDRQAADEVMRDIGLYCVPVAVSPSEYILREFGDEFATVIRLALDDDRSLEVARTEMAKLATTGAPIHLFLAGLAEIEIATESVDEAEPRPPLTRTPTVVSGPGASLIERVDLAASGEWLVATVDVPEEELMTAMRASVEAKRLNPRWLSDWEGTASVSVAVRLDDRDPLSRYYAFLPMGNESSPPFRGCVNAPFSARLNRTSVSPDVPLNRLFMDFSARAAVAALEHVRARHQAYPAHVAIDLLAWNDQHFEGVAALSERGLDPLSSSLVPAQGRDSDSSLAALGHVYEWQRADAKVLTMKRVLACTDATFLPRLTPARLHALDAFARAVGRSEGLSPDRSTLADWSEVVADRLARTKLNPRTWESFYADLAAEFSAEPEALRGRKLVIDDDGRLHKCAPRRDDEEVKGAIVFFPPRDAAADDDEALNVRIRGSLRRRIVFVNESIRWLDDSRRATPARQLFDSNRLIRPFDRRSLIEHVGRVLRNARSANTFSEALSFAYELHRGRGTAKLDLRSTRLRVPTQGGWRLASQSHFSAPWHPSGEALERLIDLTKETCPEIASLAPRLLVAPEEFPDSVVAADWLSFLEAAGVWHGLVPKALQRRRTSFEAREIRPAQMGRALGLRPESIELWTRAIKRAGNPRPEGTYKDYAARNNIWEIPGADAYERFDTETRLAFATAVIHSAVRWQEHHWNVEFFRPHYPSEPSAYWPTPLSAFLSETPWIPVRDPDRDVVTFEPPSGAWHFLGSARDEPPTFLPLIRHDTRDSWTVTTPSCGGFARSAFACGMTRATRSTGSSSWATLSPKTESRRTVSPCARHTETPSSLPRRPTLSRGSPAVRTEVTSSSVEATECRREILTPTTMTSTSPNAARDGRPASSNSWTSTQSGSTVQRRPSRRS